MRSY
jgi:hypothetical protein